MNKQKKISASAVSPRNAGAPSAANKGKAPSFAIGHLDSGSFSASECQPTPDLSEERNAQPWVDSNGIHSRMFGARVAAGIVSHAEGAQVHELDELEHEQVESGLRPVEQRMVEKAVQAYGVTETFLLEGLVCTGADALAARLSGLHQEHCALMGHLEEHPVSDMFDEYWDGFFLRFHELRRAVGHPTIASVVTAYGWRHRTYFDHETGGQLVPLDRLIGYCLTMGGRPEYIALGEGPIVELKDTVWKETSAAEINAMNYSAPTR